MATRSSVLCGDHHPTESADRPNNKSVVGCNDAATVKSKRSRPAGTISTSLARRAANPTGTTGGRVGRRLSQSIHESATYRDADIVHTSTDITVKDSVTGRQVRLSNEELTQYTVRQLNKLVAGFPKQTITKLKQRRRTLKNRGYAQNCRHKRLDLKNKLERHNKELQAHNFRLQREVEDLRERFHQAKRENESLTYQVTIMSKRSQQQQWARERELLADDSPHTAPASVQVDFNAVQLIEQNAPRGAR